MPGFLWPSLKSFGVEAEVLRAARTRDLVLARRYVNGNECLPLIQNVQDFLDYLLPIGHVTDLEKDRLFPRGWACGPLPLWPLCPGTILDYQQGRVWVSAGSVPLNMMMLLKGSVPVLFSGFTTAWWPWTSSTRCCTLQGRMNWIQGASEAVFEDYAAKLCHMLENYRFSLPGLVSGKHRRPIESLLEEAAQKFSQVPRSQEKRPLILVGGEMVRAPR